MQVRSSAFTCEVQSFLTDGGLRRFGFSNNTDFRPYDLDEKYNPSFPLHNFYGTGELKFHVKMDCDITSNSNSTDQIPCLTM